MTDRAAEAWKVDVSHRGDEEEIEMEDDDSLRPEKIPENTTLVAFTNANNPASSIMDTHRPVRCGNAGVTFTVP